MPPKRGRGGGRRGAGAASPAGEERASPRAVPTEHAVVDVLQHGGDIPLEKLHRAYALEAISKGKPRGLEPSVLQGIKAQGEVEDAVDAVLGPDPSQRLADGDEERVNVGLRNLGMTCYINTVLQCLAASEGFSAAVLAVRDSIGATLQLQKILAALRCGVGLAWIDPEALVRELEVCSSEQQDAHEFYRLLLDFLVAQNETTAPGFGKRVRDICEGGVLKTTTCSNCNTTKLRHEAANELNCYFNKPGKGALVLEDCLDTNQTTTLAGDNQYRCEACNGYRDALQNSSFAKLPEVAVVCWVRFVYDLKKNTRIKKQNEVNFPVELDLYPWTKAGREERNRQVQPSGKANYRLLSTVHHIGTTAHGGHYVARVRDKATGDWYLYDDQRVEKDPKVKESKGRLTSNDVYLCFYVREKQEGGDAAMEDAPADPFTGSAALGQYKASLMAEVAALHAEAEGYAQNKAIATARAKGVLEWWNQRKGFSRQVMDLNVQQHQQVFVPTWWLHAFGHGKFIGPDVDSVRLAKTDGWAMDSKNEPKYLKNAPPAPADEGASQVSVDLLEPPAASQDAWHELVRDPFDPRNFAGLRCPHSQDGLWWVDPEKTRGVKSIGVEAAQQLREAMGIGTGGAPYPRVPDRICRECVRRRLLSADTEMRVEARRGEMLIAAEKKPGPGEPGYWISVRWWNEFKKKSRNKEALLQWDIFDEVRCPHGQLNPKVGSRRLISAPVFEYLTGELAFHASSPPLTLEMKDCALCQEEDEKQRSDWMAIKHVKSELRVPLKPLVDAIRKPETSGNVLTKDWLKECRDSIKKWQRSVQALKKEDLKKEQQAAKVRQKELEAALEQRRKELGGLAPMSPSLRLVCMMCKSPVLAREWKEHKNSEEHMGRAANMDELERELAELDSECSARRKRLSPDVIDVDEESPNRKRKCHAGARADREPSTRHVDPQSDASMSEPSPSDVDVEEEQEEKEDPRYAEPAHHLDVAFMLVPQAWGEAMVAWLGDAGTEVPRPEALDPTEFYCEHDSVKYNAMDFRQPTTKKEREALGDEEPPPLPMLLISAKCREVLSKHNFLDESIHAIPTFRVFDEKNADGQPVISTSTDPPPCGRGCPKAEVDMLRLRRIHYTDGVIKVAMSAKSRRRRGGPKFEATEIRDVDSSATMYTFLMKIFEATDVDIRLLHLDYKGESIAEDTNATLEIFRVPNGALVEVTILNDPRTDIAGLGDIDDSAAHAAAVETGFATSRLQGGWGGAATRPAVKSYTCPHCTFINEGQSGPPCTMCMQ